MDFLGLKAELNLPFQLIFISGAPRSGTSLMHTVICSSNDVNRWMGESIYFTNIFWTYAQCQETFQGNLDAYFDNLNQFSLYHSNLCRTMLLGMWEDLGKPKNLALKDPAMACMFPLLKGFFNDAKFILTIRNPLDILASRKQVHLKKYNEFTLDKLNFYANELLGIYNPVYKHINYLGESCLQVKYEDFVERKVDRKINDFLNINLYERDLWDREKEYGADIPSQVNVDPWITKNHWNDINNSSVGTYKKILTNEECAYFKSNYSELFITLGYDFV